LECYSQNDDAAGEVPVAFVVSFDLTEDAVKDFIAKQVGLVKLINYKMFIIKRMRHCVCLL